MNIMDSISTNSTMATVPKGEPKPRKMRLSCDACSRAKVKCDKVRPSCHRCGNMSMCCNYSPSMRLGKPRKNKISDAIVMRDIPSVVTSQPETDASYPISRTTSQFVESSPEPTDTYPLGPATPEFQYQDAFMASFNNGHSPGYSDVDSYMGGCWSADEQMMLPTTGNIFASLPPYSPSPSVSGHIRSISLRSQPELFDPTEHWQSTHMTVPGRLLADPVNILEGKNTSPSFAAPVFLPTPPVTAVVPSHDCTQFAFQTLSSLYVPSGVHSPYGTAVRNSATLPTLDDVLSTTKSAVDRLSAVLSCTCSSDQHFSTTIAFSIQKILSWYQAMAIPDHDELRCNNHADAFICIHSSQRLTAGVGDVHRTQLILGELRRVEKLIDKFSERYCNDGSHVDQTAGGSLFEALEQQLRTCVRDTFKATMKAAPEDVKRKVASRTSNHRARLNTM